MKSNNLIHVLDRQLQCEYKGRLYLVRDNGAILRLPKASGRASKLDNIWSFGAKNNDGYMIFAGNVRVHQVVCTAYHGPSPRPYMVVDHIDTNRCNNRPENLRWLTRLENALNNPITRAKIKYLFDGNLEAFIDNPAIIKTKALPPNIRWMKTVTEEEAAISKRLQEEWALIDSKIPSNGKGIGDWIFQEKEKKENVNISGEEYGLKDSLTPGCKQLEWKTPSEFPQSPIIDGERTLNEYFKHLKKGCVFTKTQYGDGGVVLDFGYNPKDDAIYVLTHNKENPVKPWAICRITSEDGFYVHFNGGSFFSEEDAQKNFTVAMGRALKSDEEYNLPVLLSSLKSECIDVSRVFYSRDKIKKENA